MNELLTDMHAALERVKTAQPNWGLPSIHLRVQDGGVEFGTWNGDLFEHEWFTSLEELLAWVESYDHAAAKREKKQREIDVLKAELARLEATK